MAKKKSDMLHGTLDALVLRTLASGSMHGYAIARWLEDRTDAALVIEEGSLYPALYRMEERGLIAADWGVSELGRRAKFYRVTSRGRRELEKRTREWERFQAAVSRILLDT
jgi:transcriptional regulator